MFEDVAQMEKEIETFRKNVVASSELVEGISKLTETTRQQKEAFSSSADELLKQIDSCVRQIKADHDSALRELSSDNRAAIAELQEKATADFQAKLVEIEKIKKTIEDCQVQISKSAESLIQENISSVEQIKADHDSALRELSNNNNAAITDFQKKSAEDLHAKLAAIETIRASIESYQTETNKKTDEQLQQLSEESERLISDFKMELASQQTAFSEKLQHTEQAINGYQADAEQKYNEFIHRLETTNVDQIFKEVQDLKQSFQTKFMIMMGGIGITLVVALLGLFLK